MDYSKKCIALDDVTVSFVRDMRAIRRSLGYSRGITALAVGYDPTTISKVETQEEYPGLGLLINLADFLRVDISQSVNYMFWHRQIKSRTLREAMLRYGLTQQELAKITGYNRRTIWRTINLGRDTSLPCLQAILDVLREERLAFAARAHIITGYKQFKHSK